MMFKYIMRNVMNGTTMDLYSSEFKMPGAVEVVAGQAYTVETIEAYAGTSADELAVKEM